MAHKNKERAREYNKAYNLKHRDRLRKIKREYMIKNRDKYNERNRIRYRTPEFRFNKLEWSCRKIRNLEFNITWEKFLDLWKNPCFYCNTKEDVMGIDRVDNNLGYLEDNVVSCCRMYNVAKNKHSVNDFLEMCLRVCNNKKLI